MVQNNLPSELVAYLAKNSQLQVQRNPGNNFSYVGLSFENEHTKQSTVRQAIAHAIDRKKIIHYVMDGGARHETYMIEVFTDKDQDVLRVAPGEVYGVTPGTVQVGTKGLRIVLRHIRESKH